MIKATSLVILLACLTGIIAVSLEKRDNSEHAHERDHAHEHDPHNDYHVPEHGYEPPSHHASYNPPAASYAYDTPSTSYGEPSYEPSYEAAPYNPLPDITPVIVGILALLGLSLLFPNNVRINNVNGKKKRSAEEGKRVKSHK